MLGFTFAMVSDVIEAGFVACGDSRASLYGNLTTVVVDVLAAPILIFGYGPIPRLEIAGAALSPVAGYAGGLALAIALALVNQERTIFSTDAVGVYTKEIREIIDIGFPTAARSVTKNSAGVILISIMYSIGGVAGLAGYLISNRVSDFALLPTRTFKQAVKSVVGQNLGADNPNRASKCR